MYCNWAILTRWKLNIKIDFPPAQDFLEDLQCFVLLVRATIHITKFYSMSIRVQCSAVQDVVLIFHTLLNIASPAGHIIKLSFKVCLTVQHFRPQFEQ